MFKISARYCNNISHRIKPKTRKCPKYIDPNYPKRPLNGYLRFWLQFQPEFMEKNKNVKISDVAKIAGKEWFHLGDIQRKIYQDKCVSNFQEFRDKIKEYRENDGYNKWNKIKESLPKKLYPKSPVSVYIRENYKNAASEFPNKTNKEIMQSLAENWKLEDDYTKNIYKKMWESEKGEFILKYGQYLNR